MRVMRMTRTIAILTLCLLFATPAAAFLGFGNSPETVSAQDGLARVDTSRLSPGESKHYQYREDGATIRFFVVRDAQGTVRAALDACEVCWREGKGYKLDKGAMLCVNCGQKFALNRIGKIRGGCNPHPLAFSMDGATLTVTAQELMTGIKYVPENK